MFSPVLPEYVDDLKQYSPTYARWGELEEELTEPLKGVASCVVQCSKEAEEHIQHLSEVLVPALHEYVLCAETLKVRHEHASPVMVLCRWGLMQSTSKTRCDVKVEHRTLEALCAHSGARGNHGVPCLGPVIQTSGDRH